MKNMISIGNYLTIGKKFTTNGCIKKTHLDKSAHIVWVKGRISTSSRRAINKTLRGQTPEIKKQIKQDLFLRRKYTMILP